jgi:excisionase family DNA binding protein
VIDVATRDLPTLLLTTKELAQVLRCGETKAKALLRTGVIPSVLIGGQRRTRMRDLQAYIDSLQPSLPTADEGEAA